MTDNASPELFGLKKSNKDFTQKESWGKNQFNNAFPASLACYMGDKNLSPVYIKINRDLEIVHGTVTVEEIFGLKPLSENLFFGFEKEYAPYAPFVVEALPRIDLVTYDISGAQNKCLKIPPESPS